MIPDTIANRNPELIILKPNQSVGKKNVLLPRYSLFLSKLVDHVRSRDDDTELRATDEMIFRDEAKKLAKVFIITILKLYNLSVF